MITSPDSSRLSVDFLQSIIRNESYLNTGNLFKDQRPIMLKRCDQNNPTLTHRAALAQIPGSNTIEDIVATEINASVVDNNQAVQESILEEENVKCDTEGIIPGISIYDAEIERLNASEEVIEYDSKEENDNEEFSDEYDQTMDDDDVSEASIDSSEDISDFSREKYLAKEK